MAINKSYFRIALALLPDYPLVSSNTKSRVAEEAAAFMPQQLSQQPYYMLIPLKVLVMLLSTSILLVGPSALSFWRRLPAGGMIERLFRSLVTLIFFENTEVLSCLGEKTGQERTQEFRAVRGNINETEAND